ncbi:MAG: hypothetical protein M0Q22_04440 [Sulfuritalea sp.]|jgi:hypothetical protein|nr:hypothetical protein [Sulfuritalea sp.]
MTITGLGLGLIGLGVVLVIGAGMPQRGFWKLLEGASRAAESQQKPNLDESFARITLRFYIAGGAMVAIGICIYLVGKFLGE